LDDLHFDLIAKKAYLRSQLITNPDLDYSDGKQWKPVGKIASQLVFNRRNRRIIDPHHSSRLGDIDTDAIPEEYSFDLTDSEVLFLDALIEANDWNSPEDLILGINKSQDTTILSVELTTFLVYESLINKLKSLLYNPYIYIMRDDASDTYMLNNETLSIPAPISASARFSSEYDKIFGHLEEQHPAPEDW